MHRIDIIGQRTRFGRPDLTRRVLLSDENFEGTCGPAVITDGTKARARLGRSAEVITANLRGRFSEASQRRSIWIGSTPAAGVTVPIYNSTTQQCVLYNPLGSNKRLSLLRTSIGYISGTMVAGHFVYATQTLLSSAVSGTQSALINNGLLQNASIGGATGILYTAATVVAMTYLMNVGISQVVQAATATNAPWTMIDEVEGMITIPPGGAIAVAANVAAAVVANISLVWEELDLAA